MSLGWSRLSLRARILTGFSGLLVLFVIGGLVAWYGLDIISQATQQERQLAALSQQVSAVNLLARDFRIFKNEKIPERFAQSVAELKSAAETFAESLANEQRRAEVKTVVETASEFAVLFDKVVANQKQRRQLARQIQKLADNFVEVVDKAFREPIAQRQSMAVIENEQLSATVIEVLALSNRISEIFKGGQAAWSAFLLYQDKEDKDEAERLGQAFQKTITDLRRMAGVMESEEKRQDIVPNVERLAGMFADYLSLMNEMVALREEDDRLTTQMGQTGQAAEDKAAQISAQVREDLEAAERRITLVVVVLFGGAVVLGFILAWLIARSIARPLKRTIAGLTSGADQVALASRSVSTSSTQLAEASSEQAASLEETSSSLEEMAAMIKANADNATQANSLMKETGSTMSMAGEAMDEMAKSMAQIAEAGTEISKIIKSIDEIAFQTNLLALNAAVEAARAGEAGMGFAVVADEVRNLAQRAAEASKNTQVLIEDTVRRINQGAELVAKTQSGFSEVTESTQKMAVLISEIAAASNEQAQGIDQLNAAVTQMDRVVQQNAANAEESASAAAQMDAQAAVMKNLVGDLVTLVDGGRATLNAVPPAEKTDVTSQTPKLIGPAGQETPPVEKAEGEVQPEQVIPFDEDEDLAEF